MSKVLPEQPTAEMVSAGAEKVLSLGHIDVMHFDDRPEHGIIGRGSAAAQIYRAMYDAAPDSPLTELQRLGQEFDAAPDTSAEAVAWQYRIKDRQTGDWSPWMIGTAFGYGTECRPLYLHPSPSPDGLDVDALAQEIRRVDGNHKLGAGALAEALIPFLKSWLGVGW